MENLNSSSPEKNEKNQNESQGPQDAQPSQKPEEDTLYIPEQEESGEQNPAQYIKTQRDKLKHLQKQCAEYLEGWQRERAAFANYKKEQDKYAESLKFYALEDILMQLIQIRDSFIFAQEHIPADSKKQAWFDGLNQIDKQILQLLTAYGVQEIEAKAGDTFNPTLHESVDEEKSKQKSGTIIKILQIGYTIKDKLLRPTRVHVAK